MQYSASFKHVKAAKLLLLPTVLAFSQFASADADIAVQIPGGGTAAQATTNVDISVVVPEILIFGVGDLGTTIAGVEWTVSDAAGTAVGNNQAYSGALPSTFTGIQPYSNTPTAAISNGGAGSSTSTNTANLPVFVFSNAGRDVQISSTVSAGATGGGTADVLDHTTLTDTIAISEFASGEVGTAIVQPDFAAGGTQTETITAGGSVINATDTWTYSYTPTATPTAGRYQARITYVAAQL